MNPLQLYVTIVRFPGSLNPSDFKTLLVLEVVGHEKDWRVSVFWPKVGQVDFSLHSGHIWGKRGAHNFWRLEAGSVRDIVAACQGTLTVPASFKGTGFWAYELPADQLGAAGHG